MSLIRPDGGRAASLVPRLGDYAADAVRIVCRRCQRDSQHPLDRLVARFGPDAELSRVLSRLADCPSAAAWQEEGPCWAEFSPLALPRLRDAPVPPRRGRLPLAEPPRPDPSRPGPSRPGPSRPGPLRPAFRRALPYPS